MTDKVARYTTAQLIAAHRHALTQFWAAIDGGDRENANVFEIVVNALADEFQSRDIPCTPCCYCPVEGSYHDDPRGCDLTANPAVTAVTDALMDSIARAGK
jgi:hypothetical protein